MVDCVTDNNRGLSYCNLAEHSTFTVDGSMFIGKQTNKRDVERKKLEIFGKMKK